MLTVVVFEFPYDGPWGNEMTEHSKGLAADIAQEEGLAWKIWTEAPERKRAGGIYLFTTPGAADRYTEMHSARLAQFGFTDIDVRRYSVNAGLTEIVHGKTPVIPAG